MSTTQPSGVLKLNDDIDDKIGTYSKFLETVSDSQRQNFQAKLLSAKLMKEKLIAMTALARAQTILAEMDVLVAEGNLNFAIEQLDKFTKDHNVAPPVAKKKSSDNKSKSQNVPITPASTETVKNNTKIDSTESNKENPNIQTLGKTKTALQLSDDSQKLQKPCSRTPTEKNSKRRSESSIKTKLEKRPKLTHDSSLIPKVDGNKSTLLMNTLSPIAKLPTGRQRSEYTKRIGSITNPVIEDDENTILIENLSVDQSTHRDAINLSKALQKIMPHKTERYQASDLRHELSQSPVLTKIQLLFEDDPAELKKGKSSVVNVKDEVDSDPLNNSTENLVNGLFKDIMQAKLKHVASQASSSSNTVSGTNSFCRAMLREILEQC